MKIKKENKRKDTERKNRRITKGKGRKRWLRCEIKEDEEKKKLRKKQENENEENKRRIYQMKGETGNLEIAGDREASDRTGY